MAYVESGTCFTIHPYAGECLPITMLPGLFEVGTRWVNSQGKWYFTDTTFCLKWPNGTIMDFLHDHNNINKTLVAVKWTGTNGHTIYMHLSRTANEYELTCYIEDQTAHEIIYNYTSYVKDTLEYIEDYDGQGFRGIVCIQFCIIYDAPNNIVPYLYEIEYQGHPSDVGPYANGAVNSIGPGFPAISDGSELAQLAFAAFQGIGSVVPDNPTPSEPTEDQNPEIEYRDDKVDFPDLPTDTVLSTDFIKLYHLDNAGLSALASDLWDNNFYSNILKNYDSPFENIISLNILPVAVTGTSSLVIIGNYETAVSGEAIATQFVDLDGGSCRIDRLRDNQLDFEPARTLSIYIPFIGYRQVDLDDLTGGTAYLKYRLDLLTGNLLAMLRIVLDRNSSGRYSHDSVEYFFNGNCATSIPVSGSNYATQYSNMLNGAMSCTSSILSGGMTGAVGGASSIMNSKPTYQRSGSLSGNVGFMGNMTAFFLLSSPLPHIPENARQLMGYRSMIYRSFENLAGFEQIEKHYASAALAKECTKEELDEIERLLKEGVIF